MSTLRLIAFESAIDFLASDCWTRRQTESRNSDGKPGRSSLRTRLRLGRPSPALRADCGMGRTEDGSLLVNMPSGKLSKAAAQAYSGTRVL
ncbi:MAG: hypothetical protein QOH24_630 [Verrucomicrobiota bacterium]